MKKLRIKSKPWDAYNHRHIGRVEWTGCTPFVLNDRGVLYHRVRFAGAIVWDGALRHYYVTYFCGNGTNGTGNLIWADDVPPDRVLCERCESAAVASGLPSADAIAGHHVHIGGVRAFKVCCQDDRN